MRARYQPQATNLELFLRAFCEGNRRHRVVLDIVEWDEAFLDVDLQCSCSSQEQKEEEALREAQKLAGYIRTELRRGLGYSLLFGVGWTRAEAVQACEESIEGEPGLGAGEAAVEEEEGEEEADNEPDVLVEPEDGGWEEEKEGPQSGGSDRRGGQGNLVVEGEREREEGGVVVLSNGSSRRQEGAEPGSDMMVEDKEREQVRMAVDEPVEGEGGHVCGVCLAYFETGPELARHWDTAKEQDDASRRRRRRRTTAAEDAERARQQQQQQPLRQAGRPGEQAGPPWRTAAVADQHAARPTAAHRRPSPLAQAASRGAGDGAAPRRRRQAADSFTAVLEALDEEQQIRDYLSSCGSPVIALPGWPLTPIDLTAAAADDEQPAASPSPTRGGQEEEEGANASARGVAHVEVAERTPDGGGAVRPTSHDAPKAAAQQQQGSEGEEGTTGLNLSSTSEEETWSQRPRLVLPSRQRKQTPGLR